MKPKVIAVTTEREYIAKMLGVKNEDEYGLYKETPMGKYYARVLPDGTFSEEKAVRLISYEQAAQLNSSIRASIKEADKKAQEILDSAPQIDMEQFNRNLEGIQYQSKESAEKIKEDAKKAQEILDSAPKIDMEQFNSNLKGIQSQVKARAEKIGADIRSSLERAGLHPTYL